MAAFSFGTITSQGVGSSLNVNSIVSQLMAIERAPLDRLTAEQKTYDTKISALGSIKSSLAALQSALAGLQTGTSLQATTASSSNTAVVAATGTSGAVVGNHSIVVSQLAQSQTLIATGQASTTAAIGAGTATTVTIDLGTISGGTFNSGTGQYTGATFTSNGGTPATITIDSTNNTLAGIRDAINNANMGVTASIINDGSATNPYRLVLTSPTGATQSMKITVTGDATVSSLLAYNPAATQNLSQTVAAQNANFTVDSISFTKLSNRVTDAIAGVTLDLKGTNVGSPATVSVTPDTTASVAAVKSVVDAYNSLRAEIKKQTNSGSGGGTAGALASDYLTNQLLTSVTNELTTAPTGVTGPYTNLSSIGVTFQKDGTLALDTAALTAALQSNTTNVSNLFSATTGYATRLNTVLSGMLAVGGTVDARQTALRNSSSALVSRQAELQSRLDRTEARLRAQFTNLDVLMSNMSVTSTYLTQQLAGLNAQTK